MRPLRLGLLAWPVGRPADVAGFAARLDGFVAVAPTVGAAPWSAALDANRGFAVVFGPVDRGFPEDGVLARGALDAPGWVFCNLDPARLDTVRREGAVLNHRDWPTGPVAPPRLAIFA